MGKQTKLIKEFKAGPDFDFLRKELKVSKLRCLLWGGESLKLQYTLIWGREGTKNLENFRPLLWSAHIDLNRNFKRIN